MNATARYIKGHLPVPANVNSEEEKSLFDKTMDAISVALAATPAPTIPPPVKTVAAKPTPKPKTEAACNSIETGFSASGVRTWVFRYDDGTVYTTADAVRAQQLAELHFPTGASSNGDRDHYD